MRAADRQSPLLKYIMINVNKRPQPAPPLRQYAIGSILPSVVASALLFNLLPSPSVPADGPLAMEKEKQKQKRSRRSAPKSRGGCLTCSKSFRTSFLPPPPHRFGA